MFFVSVYNTVSNYLKLSRDPKTIAELRENRVLRHRMLIDAIVNLKKLDAKETAAAKQFWAVQTWFFVDYLLKNKNVSQLLGIDLDAVASLTKENLLSLLEKMIAILQSTDEEKNKILLQAIIDDSKITTTERQKHQANNNPKIIIQNRDSIAFTRKLIADGKVVVIMDASNAQRPGAGAYERGTFQEALTRNTDLYWKILADFNNVLKKAVDERRTSLAHAEKDLAIDVQSYQTRYMQLILYFIKKTLIDPHYFDRSQAREEFFHCAGDIYGEMQNTVLEIPSDQAFTKNCQFVDLSDIDNTSKLFDKDGHFNMALADRVVGRAYIVEVAAPDCRATEGLTDKSCTVDDLRRTNQHPETIIRFSLENTLKKAISVNADTIILNAFGCKAFENNPEQVAKIFAEVLLRYYDLLKDKTIYFLDLDASMCTIFGKTFSNNLGRFFDFNPHEISGAKLFIRPTPIQGVLEKEVVFAPTLKASETYSTLKDKPISEKYLVTPKERKEKTVMSLKAELIELFMAAAKTDAEAIHLPLLGSGKRGFHPADCTQALIEALEHVSAQYPNIKAVKIYLHIPEADKYHTVINWLADEREPIRKNELKKYFTLVHPDRERRMGFGIGLFLTQGRVTLSQNWKKWTKITDKLYLGKIPTLADAQVLNSSLKGLSLVVSAVEDFELAGEGIFLTPTIQRASGWAKFNVRHHQVIVKDGHADDFPHIEIARTIAKILQTINNGETVYVHCKAGRSRSATIVALTLYFLLKQEGSIPDIQEIYDYLTTVRQEVSLCSVEIANLKRIIKFIEKHPELLQPEPLYYLTILEPIQIETLKNHVEKYVVSDNGKAEISQLPAFKDLKYAAICYPNQSEWIQKWLNEIYMSHDGSWINKLFADTTAILQPFKEQLKNLLAVQLNVAQAQIASLVEPPIKLIAIKK